MSDFSLFFPRSSNIFTLVCFRDFFVKKTFYFGFIFGQSWHERSIFRWM